MGKLSAVLTLCLSAVFSNLLLLCLGQRGIAFSAGQAIVLGVLALFAVNIVLFLTNMFLALSRPGLSDNEEELEEQLAPSLQGAPNNIGPGTAESFRHIMLACIGATVGAVIFILIN